MLWETLEITIRYVLQVLENTNINPWDTFLTLHLLRCHNTQTQWCLFYSEFNQNTAIVMQENEFENDDC